LPSLCNSAGSCESLVPGGTSWTAFRTSGVAASAVCSQACVKQLGQMARSTRGRAALGADTDASEAPAVKLQKVIDVAGAENEYERARDEQIERNKERLQALQLQALAAAVLPLVPQRSAAPKKSNAKRAARRLVRRALSPRTRLCVLVRYAHRFEPVCLKVRHIAAPRQPAVCCSARCRLSPLCCERSRCEAAPGRGAQRQHPRSGAGGCRAAPVAAAARRRVGRRVRRGGAARRRRHDQHLPAGGARRAQGAPPQRCAPWTRVGDIHRSESHGCGRCVTWHAPGHSVMRCLAARLVRNQPRVPRQAARRAVCPEPEPERADTNAKLCHGLAAREQARSRSRTARARARMRRSWRSCGGARRAPRSARASSRSPRCAAARTMSPRC